MAEFTHAALITQHSLPYVTEHLAADSAATGFFRGHDALRRGDDGDSKSAQYPRKVILAGIDSQAGLAHALEVGNDPLATRAVLQVDLDPVLLRILDDFETLNETFILQNPDHLGLDLTAGDLQGVVVRVVSVPDAGQEVRNRICRVCHGLPPTSSTWSRRGEAPGAPAHGSRFDRFRTCGIQLSGARKCCSGYSRVRRTWASAAAC